MARQPKSTVDAARRAAAKSKAATNPATPSLEYKALQADWALISTVLGGTGAMRAAGKSLLPQHEGESALRYKGRLASSVLTNFTSMTLDHWCGKPFTKPASLSEDTDDEIKKLADDINLCGDELTVVLKEWFTLGMAKRKAYCLVDFPEVPEHLRGRVTLADERRLNLRPYWVIIPAEAVIAPRKERINGEDVFTNVRFFDNRTVYDGYEEKIEVRIREYDRNVVERDEFGEEKIVEIRQRVHTRKSGKADDYDAGPWKVVDIDRIPLVEFDTKKLELLDLAYLNVTHYQSTSDQRNCLTTARFPILAGSGVDSDTVITIGPYAFLSAKDSAAKFYYVEHSGSALDAGQVDIDKLEEAMALYGAEMLKQRPDRETATSRVLDQAQHTAPLQVHTFAFISAVDMALYITKLWMEKGEEVVARVVIDTDFAMSSEDSAKVDNLKELRKTGDVSREQLLKGLKDAKGLPESFDEAANTRELNAEAEGKAKAALEAATKLAAASPKPEAAPAKADKPGEEE